MNWLAPEQLLFAQAHRPVCEQLSHTALCKYALRLAADWQVQKIQRIALSIEDRGAMAIALLAAWRAGIEVFLPADNSMATRQRLHQQDALWLEHLPDVISAPLPATELDLNSCRLWLCTSGSSGSPKTIAKTLQQLATEVMALETLWGEQLGHCTVLASVSAQHIYGLLFALLWPLCAGRPFIRTALPFPEDLQQASVRCQDFAWVASPALLKRMNASLNWSELRRIRALFSSGGVLPSTTAQTLYARLGQYPTEIYGSSETGGIAWRQGDTPWQPFSGVELSQNSGALQVVSPYLPAGHIEPMNDALELLADGQFILHGRLDRIVKLEEKRIALPALEQALLKHPWVDETRLGVIYGQRAFLGALVVLSRSGLYVLCNQGRRALTDTLRTHLAAYCAPIALPRRWRLLEHLPYNQQGKLVQNEVENLLLTERPGFPDVLSATEENGHWHLHLAVPPDLNYFSGHFPQAPIVPGVVQLDWVVQLARLHITDLPAQFAGMETLKFQQLIRPCDRLNLSFHFDNSKKKLYFSFKNGDKSCSSGRILLT